MSHALLVPSDKISRWVIVLVTTSWQSFSARSVKNLVQQWRTIFLICFLGFFTTQLAPMQPSFYRFCYLRYSLRLVLRAEISANRHRSERSFKSRRAVSSWRWDVHFSWSVININLLRFPASYCTQLQSVPATSVLTCYFPFPGTSGAEGHCKVWNSHL